MRGSNASDAPTSPLLARPGVVVAGKFRVERILAEGGMGVVVAATHIQLDRPVALKFLRADISANLEALARFTREAKAAAQLKSEHVAHVLDVGVTDDGTPYMVMEYLDGQSLYRVLQTQGPLSIASAADYAIQTCEGLAEAHARGIVHRDVKPDNLFLIERSPGWRSIKILDFGISKIPLTDANNIATGVIMGSPCYMSPEQLRSTATVDHRTDIWSLGATLYELLTDKAAFDASLTLPELVATILHKPPPSLPALRPDIPAELAAVIGRCLEKDREARFASAAELARALLPFAPERARSAAERAGSMAPAFPVSRRGSSAPPSAPPSGPSPDTQSEMHPVGVNTAPRVTTHSGLGGTSVTPMPLGMTTPPIAPVVAEAVPSRRPKWTTLVTWGLAGVLVVALIATLRRKPQTLAAAVPAPSQVQAPAADNVPSFIDLQVRVSPVTAQITIDGAPVSGNPYRARYPRDQAVHQIRASAPGFEPKWEDVPLQHDVVVDMSLDRQMTALHVLPTPSPQGRVMSPAAPAARSNPPARVIKRVSATPAASLPAPAREPLAAPPLAEVSPTGGRPPLRPIETKNPYGSP
jgi:serine/threonine protein kinase